MKLQIRVKVGINFTQTYEGKCIRYNKYITRNVLLSAQMGERASVLYLFLLAYIEDDIYSQYNMYWG